MLTTLAVCTRRTLIYIWSFLDFFLYYRLWIPGKFVFIESSWLSQYRSIDVKESAFSLQECIVWGTVIQTVPQLYTLTIGPVIWFLTYWDSYTIFWNVFSTVFIDSFRYRSHRGYHICFATTGGPGLFCIYFSE